MHEIVTLQFGQQSNYLGTHFWNIQESYFTYGGETESPVDHDIHFRQGIAPDGSDTFTPRTVIYDLKGAFGSLKKINALYEVQEEQDTSNNLWSGSTVIHRQAPIPQSDYQQHLDAGLPPPPLTTEAVRYWSDYARVFFHPRSLIQLHEYELNSQLMPFERWDAGEELFSNLDREHDLLDRDLRPFIEECDQLQGLQVLSGVSDAWGGFAARYVDRLRDEFGKTSVWVWGLEEGGWGAREKQLQQLINTARSVYELSTQVSVYIPVSNQSVKSPSYLALDPGSMWHTSAMQATAMESITLPSRLRLSETARRTLSDMEASFNNDGTRKIVKLEYSVADPETLKNALAERAPQQQDVRMNGYSPDGFEEDNVELSHFDIDLSAGSSVPTTRRSRRREHVFGRTQISRGDWSTSEQIENLNQQNRDRFGEGPIVENYQSPLLFPILDSFPHIYNIRSGPPSSLAVQASLSASTALADRIRYLAQIARRSVGVEEREALANGLEGICEEYVEGWDSGDEDDEDS